MYTKTHHMKKILIPTDFSKNANDAVSYAISFLQGQEGYIQLVHVIRPVMVDTIDSAMMNATATEIVKEQAEKNMKSLRGEVLQNTKGLSTENIKLSTMVIVGDVITEINRAATEFEADLIILGTRGAGYSVSDRMLGTISTQLIANSVFPLLLVPKDYKFEKIDNLIFATNLDTGDPYELNRALIVLKPHSPLVNIIYVKQPYTESEPSTNLDAFAKYMVDHSTAIKTTF